MRLLALTVVVLAALSSPAPCQTPAGSSTPASYTDGELLIAPQLARGLALQQRLLQTMGLKTTDVDTVSGVLRLQVPAGQEAALLAQLNADPDVVYAERNGVGQGGLLPNDTFFAAQWHLQNTGQGGGTPGADVRATDAWDVTTGSPNIVIAVLDTGIDTDHPEFAGRIDADGYDFVNEDNDPEADHPHGSQVAGVMCAHADNHFGITGVDWQCKVLPIKVLDAGNAGTVFDLAQGLNYCATQADVQVISMSLINYPNSPTLNHALQTVRNAGKIVISCAGNGGLGNADVSYPGASPLTISIGATTRDDGRAIFSATGTALDFVAPGADVVTIAHGTSANLTSVASGCSFATPITAGIVGLALARAEALAMPLPTHDQIYDLLLAGAVDQVGPTSEDTPGRDDFFGHGRIDARLVVDAVQQLISCEYGSVGVGLGGPFDVVRVNGLARQQGSRTITVPENAPMTLSVDVPPSLPQPGPVPPFFLLWARTGDLSSASPFVLPLGLGEMCFDPTDPMTFLLFADIAPWSTTTGPMPQGFTATLQGVMFDTPQGDIAVTNRVTFDPQVFPAPTITVVLPQAAAPGAAVGIVGSGFLPGLTLRVDGVVTTPTLVAASEVTFTAPATAQCDTTLTITNPDGQVATAPFNVSPTITNVVGIGGTPSAGGNTLLLFGQNFVPGTVATIGGMPMTITTTSPGVISGVLPPGPVGPAAVVVTTPFGCTTTGSLTYTP